MCRSELKADKSTALKWLAYDKAFKPIDNDKTYAQALTQTKSNKCYDVQPLRAAIAKPNKQFLPTPKVHRKYQSKLYHNKASLANNGRGPGTNIRSGDLQTNKVIFRENKVGVTVAGASPCRAPVLLKTDFIPCKRSYQMTIMMNQVKILFKLQNVPKVIENILTALRMLLMSAKHSLNLRPLWRHRKIILWREKKTKSGVLTGGIV